MQSILSAFSARPTLAFIPSASLISSLKQVAEGSWHFESIAERRVLTPQKCEQRFAALKCPEK
ncbi:MAG: hypothetical protein WB608_00950, partial [Terracidiphilus sp.]